MHAASVELWNHPSHHAGHVLRFQPLGSNIGESHCRSSVSQLYYLHIFPDLCDVNKAEVEGGSHTAVLSIPAR